MTEHDRSRRFALGVLLTLALSAALALTPYSVDSVLPVFPEAADALGVSASGIQATMTAYLAGVVWGQLVFGPVSDRLGRRGPLLTGTALAVVGAVGSALAPDVALLVVARAVQGIGASATMVLSRSIVRDVTSGTATARVLATITALSGAAAIAAPVVGGLLAEVWGWRAPFWFLVALSAALLLTVLLCVPETLPAHVRATSMRAHHYLAPFRDARFRRYSGVQACATASMMAYVASSPFLYQVVLHFEPATYGLLFAANALVAVLVNLFVNHRLRHVGSHRIVRWGFGVSLVGTAGTGVSLLAGAPPLPVVVFVCVSMCTFGMTGANVVALALNRMASGIGTAAAVIGFVQFVTGASVSPLVGLAGGDTQIVPLALMTVAAATGLVLIGRAPGAASTPSVRE